MAAVARTGPHRRMKNDEMVAHHYPDAGDASRSVVPISPLTEHVVVALATLCILRTPTEPRRAQKDSKPAAPRRDGRVPPFDECTLAFGDESHSDDAGPHDRNRHARTLPADCALATFRVLAKGDLDADAALASAVGCPPPPRSLTPPRRPLSDQRGRAARGCGAAEIVRKR